MDVGLLVAVLAWLAPPRLKRSIWPKRSEAVVLQKGSEESGASILEYSGWNMARAWSACQFNDAGYGELTTNLFIRN